MQGKMTVRQGERDGTGRRFAVLVSRFNDGVTRLLEEGAVAAFRAHGVADEAIEVIRVPGAFELPAVAARVVDRGGVDGIVALGCVIRGETPHFDYVAGEAARGLAELARTAPVPVVFGVLTTETLEQALVRAGARSDDPAANKGWEGAEVALEMAHLYEALR
jgi:6,7-dimethyl-8-ribityllumazine synthase